MTCSKLPSLRTCIRESLSASSGSAKMTRGMNRRFMFMPNPELAIIGTTMLLLRPRSPYFSCQLAYWKTSIPCTSPRCTSRTSFTRSASEWQSCHGPGSRSSALRLPSSIASLYILSASSRELMPKLCFVAISRSKVVIVGKTPSVTSFSPDCMYSMMVIMSFCCSSAGSFKPFFCCSAPSSAPSLWVAFTGAGRSCRARRPTRSMAGCGLV
mmetsp:Transcript_26998/g.61377  ORF Transcript_26998/g.61377 Transcript_26998/m.61377 type:complete len:212 (+) Transcript_26998:381-1016(+)